MNALLVQIVFGWPGAVASFIVSTFGLVKQRYWLLIIGAGLLAPSAYYLSGAPASYRLPLLLPLFLLGSAFAVYKRKTMVAWFLSVPPFLSVVYYIFLFIYVRMTNVR